MKRTISLLMAVLMLLSLTVTVLADGTTTLTTTVPAATYTLNIPADTEVEFGALSTDIAVPTVTDSSGFAVGKDIQVSVTYTPFSSTEKSSTIPFTLTITYESGYGHRSSTFGNGSAIYFRGNSSGSVGKANVVIGSTNHVLTQIYLTFNSDDWGKALGGDYTATITFTSEVVNS